MQRRRTGGALMPCVRCLVSGHVQGVFFRASTRDYARRLGLTGWVRNLPNGCVEVLAAGSESQLRELERWLWQGPPGARVDRVTCVPAVDKGFEGFQVRHW